VESKVQHIIQESNIMLPHQYALPPLILSTSVNAARSSTVTTV